MNNYVELFKIIYDFLNYNFFPPLFNIFTRSHTNYNSPLFAVLGKDIVFFCLLQLSFTLDLYVNLIGVLKEIKISTSSV